MSRVAQVLAADRRSGVELVLLANGKHGIRETQVDGRQTIKSCRTLPAARLLYFYATNKLPKRKETR